MPYTQAEAAERRRNRQRLAYKAKPKSYEAKAIYLESQKRAFISAMLAEWDEKRVPLYKHMREWQDLTNPTKYELALEAMGQKFKVEPVPNRTIRRWMRELAIDPKLY